MKARQLVVHHLEKISGRILEDAPESIRTLIRRRCGVYALYRKGKLHYVGLASNLMNRIGHHLKDRHRGRWDTFSVYLTKQDEHIKELESLLLRIAAPSGNGQGGKFVASSSLLRPLERLMSDADADRRARLLGGLVARRRRRAKASRAKGSRVLAGVFDRRIPIRAWYKERMLRGSLRRDGYVSFRGRRYESPTAAAEAAIGRTRNGWRFWRYRDERGEWVQLERLRR